MPELKACLQTVVDCNPCFPNEGSFDLEIWHQVKEKVEQAIIQGKKKNPIDFQPLWTLTEAVILPLQGNSSPPDNRQQAEHSLRECELDDDTL